MQDGHATGWRFRPRGRAQSHDILANFGGINAIVATIQGGHKLRKDAPDESLLCVLVLGLKISNNTAQIAIATVFHVDVQVLTGFEMFAAVVSDNVGVAKGRKNGELCVQLLALLLGHFEVADLFAAEDHAIVLSADFANNPKGAMAWRRRRCLVSIPVGRGCHVRSQLAGQPCAIPIFSSTSYLSMLSADILQC